MEEAKDYEATAARRRRSEASERQVPPLFFSAVLASECLLHMRALCVYFRGEVLNNSPRCALCLAVCVCVCA